MINNNIFGGKNEENKNGWYESRTAKATTHYKRIESNSNCALGISSPKAKRKNSSTHSAAAINIIVIKSNTFTHTHIIHNTQHTHAQSSFTCARVSVREREREIIDSVSLNLLWLLVDRRVLVQKNVAPIETNEVERDKNSCIYK